jgi:uncharacterized protein DUF6631
MAKLAGKDETVVESLDSLEILRPEDQFVQIGGDKIYVRPYSFGKLPKVLKRIGKIQGAMDAFQQGGGLNEAQIIEALGEHGEDIIALISLATDIPIEMFDEIDSDVGVDLAIMAYKVNESFFVQKLLPKLQSLFPSDLQTQEEEVNPPKKSKKQAGST